MTAATQRRAENLAFCFQELLTVGERLRSGRQAVQDAAPHNGAAFSFLAAPSSPCRGIATFPR